MDQRKQARLPRSLFLFVTLAALLTSMGMNRPASAETQQGVNLTAQLGLDGYCKDETWIPVRVILENSGPDVDGRVQVSYGNVDGGQSVFGEDILLPTTSRKETFLYFYPSGSLYNLKVSLLANGKEIAKTNPRTACITSDNMLVGVMADSPASFDVLGDIKPLRGFATVAHLRPDDLPDRPQGWAALDALLVSGMDTGSLTAEQRKSLAAWLANGGKLLVMGGPQWQAAASGLQDLLPLEVTSTRNVSGLSALSSYLPGLTPPDGDAILSVGRPRPGSTVLVEQEGVPLLVEKQVGFGKVIYLAADPTLRPLSDWEGMRDVYTQWIGVRSARPQWMEGPWNTDSATHAVSTLHAIGIPSYIYICGWLILYVLVIGPINFLFLRRMKRRELAWISIPALVIFFSALAYLYGSIYRGPRPILNRLAIIQSWDGVSTGETRAMVGVYSPRRSSYTLQANDRFMLFPFESYSGSPQSGGDWLALKQADSTLLPAIRVEIGGMQALSLRGNSPALNLTHDLVLTLSDQNPEITGVITNASPYTLYDAVLVTPSAWQKLGDIPPGEGREVRLMLTTSDTADFYDSDPVSLLGYDSGDLTSNEEAVRRTQLLQAAVMSRYRDNRANGGVYLMAWVDQPVLPLEIKGKAFETIDTTLYISMLTPSVKLAAMQMKLTPGLFIWEASEKDVSPYAATSIPGGGYVLHFHPAFPLKYRSVEQLSLSLQSQNTSNIQDVNALLWDFQTAAWVKIANLRWGQQDIPEPSHYVGPGGEIRLKLSSNTWVEISASIFTLVVRP